jgi:hypothetical protein
MAPSRPRPGLIGSTKVVNALRELARLLARQAVRDAMATFSKVAAPGTGAISNTSITTNSARVAPGTELVSGTIISTAASGNGWNDHGQE